MRNHPGNRRVHDPLLFGQRGDRDGELLYIAFGDERLRRAALGKLYMRQELIQEAASADAITGC